MTCGAPIDMSPLPLAVQSHAELLERDESSLDSHPCWFEMRVMSRVRLDGRAVDTVSFRNNTIAIMCTYKYSRRSGPQVLAKNPPSGGVQGRD